MAVSNFDDEVWNALKQHWCSSPKISWQQLVNEVKEMLQRDMPNITTVRRRAISEEWQKDAKKAVKKSTRQLKKDTAKVREKIKQQTADSNKKSNAKKDADDTPNLAEIIVHSGNAEVMPSLADENRLTAAKVIIKHRQRSANLGVLVDDTIEGLIAIKEEMQSKEVSVEQLEIIQGRLAILAGMTELTEKLSRAVEKVAKVDTVFWGLELDELKDQAEATAKRNQIIEHSDALLEEQKRIMRENQLAAIQRKARFMNEGDPELVDVSPIEE